jgi:hypothetical protein
MRRDDLQQPPDVDQAWAVALGTTVLTLLISLGAALGGAPGDRLGGLILGSVLLVAIPALLLARRRPQLATRSLVAIAAAQTIVAALMIAAATGARGVVIAINAILLTGWVLAAGLFRVQSRL